MKNNRAEYLKKWYVQLHNTAKESDSYSPLSYTVYGNFLNKKGRTRGRIVLLSIHRYLTIVSWVKRHSIARDFSKRIPPNIFQFAANPYISSKDQASWPFPTCLPAWSGGFWQRRMSERMVMGRDRERWRTRLMSASRPGRLLLVGER